MVIIDIYFCTLDRSNVIQVPLLPEEIPEIDFGMDNVSFKTFNNGTYNFTGDYKPFSTSLELIVPDTPKKYNFCKSQEYISTIQSFFFNRFYFKEPVRYVVTDSEQTVWDVTCLVGDYNFSILKNKDYKLTLTLNEWKDYNAQI